MCKPALSSAVFSTISFLSGAVTSEVPSSNSRTTLEARKGVGKSLVKASLIYCGFPSCCKWSLVLLICSTVMIGSGGISIFFKPGGDLTSERKASLNLGSGGIHPKAADVGANITDNVK
ncbi:pyrophosphate-energized vacuolar membrane proton pump-like [Rhododendron vialii]|uniref:pyrophosphate-energized vacuolar membrane proton pump-like n=1 Tax=Rhododendron vialii TaxID=182163 RepID=UPI00265DA5F0|nr:pyrophosphate-energized vacuolar membrane proton pump-like [Rhododendron vialii]